MDTNSAFLPELRLAERVESEEAPDREDGQSQGPRVYHLFTSTTRHLDSASEDDMRWSWMLS